jgi:hypothetical protein
MIKELEISNFGRSLLNGLSDFWVYSIVRNKSQIKILSLQEILPSPYRMLTVAAAPFKMPKALTIGGGMRSCGWLILKFSRDRSV